MHYYLDTAGLQDFAQKLTAKNKTLFAEKSIETDVEELRNAVGSPLVAETAADMTDTDKIYVYVGSETGYTSGNWYYYDGSAWQSGGVYNSTAFVTDTTLAVAGMAADAKATGDAIGEVAGDVTDLKSAIIKCPLIEYGMTGLVYPVPGQPTGRSINTSGEIVSSYYAALSNRFAVDKGNVITAQYVTDNNGKHISTYVATYTGNSDSDFVERIRLTSEDGNMWYVIPENIKYIRILFQRGASESVYMTQDDIDSYFNATISGLGADYIRVRDQAVQNHADISEAESEIADDKNVSLLTGVTPEDNKYVYNSNGSVVFLTDSTLVCLYSIDVSSLHGKSVHIEAYVFGNPYVIMANASNQVIGDYSASGTAALDLDWTIADTAKWLYISTFKTKVSDTKALMASKDAALLELIGRTAGVEQDIQAINGSIDDIEDEIAEIAAEKLDRIIVSKNLFSTSPSDPDTLERTVYSNAQGDTTEQSATTNIPCCITGYIPVEAGKSIILSRDATPTSRTVERMRAVGFYNASKQIISCQITSYTGAPGSWLETVTTPENCAFVRLNIIMSTYTNAYYYMLEYGTSITDYEAFWPPYTVPAANPYFSDKKLCVYGDSLAADGYKGHNAWIDRVGNYYGFGTVYNRGEGGSFVTAENASGVARSSYGYVDADGYAWMRTAYTSQQSGIPGEYTEINAAMCGDARVATIPEDTDVLIIEAGINDWDSTTHTSDAGAELFETSYGTMLSKIVTRIPHAKIFCCICPYYKIADGTANAANLDKHREIIRKVARNYGCTVIDLRAEMGVNVVNVDDYSSDGLHYYLTAGKNRMANTVIGAIEGYINTFSA